MRYDSFRHHRRSLRMKGYDYAAEGAYFVTICTQFRQMLLASDPVCQMVQKTWNDLTNRFLEIRLDEFVVMPNHVHGIIILNHEINRRGESCIRPHNGNSRIFQRDHIFQGDHKDRPYGTLPKTLGRVVQAFKSITTHQYRNGVLHQEWAPFQKRLWQRNYYERIIRDDRELDQTRQYIRDNPQNWDKDPENNSCIIKNIPSLSIHS